MEKPIDIGKLNKRITFQIFADKEEDELGQNVQKWIDYKTVWADFRPVRGAETDEAARKFREERTYKATVRYLPGITSDLRIVYRRRIFEIRSVVNRNEADYILEIECTEYVERREKSEC